MTKLRTRPEIHFREVDYQGSELLIFKYDAGQRRLLLCFNDLSEKIPDWVKARKSTAYSFRYKVVRFKEIANFVRSEVDEAKFGATGNDFYIIRHETAVPIEDIEVKRVSGDFAVEIYFERGFGIAAFRCRDISIDEVPFYFKNRRGGKNYYYVDTETKQDFDEDEFLADLYRESSLTE